MFGRIVAILVVPLVLGTIVAANRLAKPAPVAVQQNVAIRRPFVPPQVSLDAISLERKPDRKRKKRTRVAPPKTTSVAEPAPFVSATDSAATESLQPSVSTNG